MVLRTVRRSPTTLQLMKKIVTSGMPFTGHRQHSRSISGVSQDLQTHEVKSRTFLAP